MEQSTTAAEPDRQKLSTLFQSDPRYKYLDSFITLFVVLLLISNLVASKLIAPVPDVPAFHWLSWLRVSGAQFVFPITYIFGDIFTEVYGYSASRRAIWYGFFASGLLFLITYVCVVVPPAPEYKNQAAFASIFRQIPRILAGSLIAFWCGEFANSFTLAKLKLITKGDHLWTRTIGSTLVGQAVDTTIVIFFVFYGQVPLHTIFSLILSGYLFKVLYETVMTPFTYLVVNFLKRAENADYYDYKTNFNPFATKS